MKIPSTFRRWVSDAPASSFREAAKLRTFPIKPPAPDQVLVQTIYSTINGGHDTFVARREWFWSDITGTCNLGADSLGQIVEVGSDVKSLQVGDYVTSVLSGGFSEYTTPLASRCFKVISPKMEYAVLRVSGTLLCAMFEVVYKLEPGKTLLITASAGGVGHLAVQLGKLCGCHVIGTCGGAKKKEVVESLGADRVINYHEESVDEVLKNEYPDGIDYVLDHVGGVLFKTAFDHLASNGMLFTLGAFSQYPHTSVEDQQTDFELAPGFPTSREFITGNKTIVIGDKQLIHPVPVSDPQKLNECRVRAVQLFEDQRWKVVVDQYALTTFKGLEGIPDSIDYVLSGQSVGKVLSKIRE